MEEYSEVLDEVGPSLLGYVTKVAKPCSRPPFPTRPTCDPVTIVKILVLSATPGSTSPIERLDRCLGGIRRNFDQGTVDTTNAIMHTVCDEKLDVVGEPREGNELLSCTALRAWNNELPHAPAEARVAFEALLQAQPQGNYRFEIADPDAPQKVAVYIMDASVWGDDAVWWLSRQGIMQVADCWPIKAFQVERTVSQAQVARHAYLSGLLKAWEVYLLSRTHSTNRYLEASGQECTTPA